MKLIHLSDLHLGKRVHEYPMLEDQTYILRSILRIVEDETPDAVVIAGDVYDRPVPPAEAVRLFDDFLFGLALLCGNVFVISGNHDSAERIAFGGRLMSGSGVHVSRVYDGTAQAHVLTDEHGELAVYLLPFVRPAEVRALFPDEPIDGFTDAVACAVRHMNIDPARRNILVTHQFVTGAERSDSEDVSVGGADGVDAAVFDPFDYVALGHLHGPQRVGRDTLRYCGSPLKYSFSEKDQKKSVTVVELGAKGSVNVRTAPLTPLREMREIRGSYDELTLRKNYENTAADDYLRVILTDEEDVPDAMRRLRTVYPNIMRLAYDNRRTRSESSPDGGAAAVDGITPLALFGELYEAQNGQPMSGEQQALAAAIFEALREEQP